MRLLLPALLLLACTPKQGDSPDTDGDTDTDTDTDTDADADTDTDTALTTWFADDDNDGYGNPNAPREAATQPPGTSDNNLDCNDLDANIRPDATEVCDRVDNDCDGLKDDADDSLDVSTGETWYLDADGDGHIGDSSTVLACAPPAGAGTLADADDCDDGDASVHPDAAEVCNDNVDNDCDGAATGCRLGDGSAAGADIRYLPRASGDYAGTAVALADVNGDGDLDLLVGSPGSELDPDHTGEVTAWTTNVAGVHPYTDAWAAATIGSDDAFIEAAFGTTLARVGDTNSDGADEWLAGGPGYRGHAGSWGFSYGASVFPSVASETGAGGTDQRCGIAVAAGADVSGDGSPDWAIGCNGTGAGWGEVRVYSGISTWVTITADSGERELGGALAMADFNGDGVGDLAVAATDEPMVYWFAGPVGGGTVAATSDGEGPGTSGDDSVLANVGDPNNDGYPDLVAGAGQDDDSRFYGGGARDLLGTSGIPMGQQINAAAGGDLDGDGIDDLAVGATWGIGEVNFCYGPTGSTFPAAAWYRILGESSDQLGSSIAIGDVDNDGIGDLVAGAVGDDDAGAAAGAVFVFRGLGM